MEEPLKIGYEIKAVSNLLKRKIFETGMLEKKPITEMQMRIIDFLYRHQEEDIFQRDLEEALSVRRSSVSRFLAAMERQGLLLRQPVPQDARLKKLTLTPAAVADHEQGIRQIQRIEEVVARGLSAEEIQEFYRVLLKIKRNLS